MQEWELKYFEANNRKLRNYLMHVDNAIVLLCANNQKAVIELKNMLCNEYSFDMIDYSREDTSFPFLIQQYADDKLQNRICFYNMMEENSKIDLIKTMNLSRDLLRKVGIAVLILPSFAVEQIKMENPHLYDYITLKLDYNMENPAYIYPVYSEENKYFVPKKVRTARKRTVMADVPVTIRNIEDYYKYLDSFEYTRKSEDDILEIIEWLFDYVKENLEAVNLMNNRESDFTEIRFQLYKRTAEAIFNQGYYELSLAMYNEILYLAQNKEETSLIEMEVLQGKAHCYYEQGDFEQTISNLNELVEQEAIKENPVWQIKIKNDIAVCLCQLDRIQEAFDLWKECHQELKIYGEYKTHRKLRVLYNIMLLSLKYNQHVMQYKQEWIELEDEIKNNLGTDALEYFNYEFMTAWLKWKDGKLNEALKYGLETERIGIEILPENDEKKVQVYYLLSLIALERNKKDESRDYLKKGERYFQNCRRIKDDFIIKSFQND